MCSYVGRKFVINILYLVHVLDGCCSKDRRLNGIFSRGPFLMDIKANIHNNQMAIGPVSLT